MFMMLFQVVDGKINEIAQVRIVNIDTFLSYIVFQKCKLV